MKFSNLILEKAASLTDAVSQNLAVLIVGLSDGFNVIIYSPDRIADSMNRHKFSTSEAALQGFLLTGCMAAGTMVRNYDGVPDGAYMVKFSGALKNGYGPLLYDIMISLAGKNGLCADRRLLSNDAKKVWEKYLKERDHEYVNMPIDNEKKPLTPIKTDDGSVHDETDKIENTSAYDRVFYAKNPVSLKNLTMNSDQFFTEYPQLLPLMKKREFAADVYRKALYARP